MVMNVKYLGYPPTDPIVITERSPSSGIRRGTSPRECKKESGSSKQQRQRIHGNDLSASILLPRRHHASLDRQHQTPVVPGWGGVSKRIKPTLIPVTL